MVIMVVMIGVIAACFVVNTWWIQKFSSADFSWSCNPVNAQLQLILYVPFHVVMGFSTFLCSMLFLMRKESDGDQNTSTRQVVHQKDNSKFTTKRKIIMIALFTVLFLAAGFTSLETGLPIYAVYSVQRNVFTPGDTQILTRLSNFLVSSLSIDYIGSPHLSATLYVSDEEPPLSEYTSYGVSETFLCNQNECKHIWQSYLNQQSSVNIKFCLNDSTGANNNATFCVIKGMNNFTHDVSRIQVLPGNNIMNFSVLTESNMCFEWILHNIDDADRYFFILDEYNYSIVNVELEFNRTDYSPKYTNKSKLYSYTINSHSVDTCKAHLQKHVLSSSTALIVVTSDLDKPLFEWQETIVITTAYNLRADTRIILCLSTFVLNIIAFSILITLWMKVKYKQLAAKPKSDSSTTFQNEEMVGIADRQDTNEQSPSHQSDFSSRNVYGGPEQNTNERNNSSTVIESDVPAVEVSQTLEVPVNINPDTTATAESDDEHTTCSEGDRSTSPVEALDSILSININCIIDAKHVQKDVNEEVTPIAAM